MTDLLVIDDRDRLWREQISVTMVVDGVHAGEHGSELEDEGALRRLLGEIVSELRA